MAGAILKRNGLIESRRRRPGAFEVKRGELTEATRPNHVWATDFKGWFYTQDKERCDPLTVTDLFSRYLKRGQPEILDKMKLFCRGLSEYRSRALRTLRRHPKEERSPADPAGTILRRAGSRTWWAA